MKKLLLTVALALTAGSSFSQTTLFSENFETGGAGFTLNTSDMSGMAGLAGTNAWVINNSYTGGSGTSSCFGLGFTIGNTPSQPGGFTNGPNSTNMHILSDDGTANGITNANYAPADGSFCFFAESNFSRMAAPVSTVGYSNVTFSFWWLGVTSTTSYGEVYYSLDGGTTWTLKQGSMYNQGSWVQVSLTDAAWNNVASLRFGIRFVNNTSASGADPALSIDEVLLSGTAGSSSSVATSNLSQTTWCSGTTIDDVLDFTATGTYNAGNVYTAQLSDAAGSFAAPTTIGTLTSTASGTLSINITIPGSTPAGSGYRVRVVASNPSTIGTDNGVDIVINQTPTVTLGALSNVCVYNPSFSLSGGSPAGGIYSGPGVTGGMFDPATAGLGTHTITYTYTDPNGCLSSATQTILVDACVGLTDLENDAILIHPNPASAQFSLSSTSGIESVQLVDMNGRVVKRFNEAAENYDITEIQGGVYFVHIEFEGFTSIKQLVIR